jgi:cobalt-zinc-cadmium resistance protein CzcA
MLSSLIHFSIRNKLVVFLFTAGLIGFGTFALFNLSIGAVPDITNNQVQVITTSRNLSTEDVEKFLTYPVELEMANLPGVVEIRSISKFGLSVVTIVFEEDMGTYLPRQLIAEKIKSAEDKIPKGFGSPEMGPVSTGLGEIYQYILDVKPGYEDQYSVTELRTIQDWIVKRQLSGIAGVVEINTWGGYLKTFEIAIDPNQLQSMGISITQVYEAIESNNSIAGGGYIEKSNESFFIRSEGLITSINDIKNVVVETRDGLPILIKDIAEVGFGHANRFGAITGNGQGEKVLGQIMMLKGASSKTVINDVKNRIEEIQTSLPEGVIINPILERSDLINRTTNTITENLILGCLIVIFIVILLLGNFRSGLVVASVIPLCLLFAISMMYILGIDANLMSLGAIDFGIIIDGAVIIVEYIAFSITQKSAQILSITKSERSSFMDKITTESTSKMMRSAVFGQLIIIIVFIPILTLTGIEGKMFRPMAQTFCFALIGAMILCFTYVPVMSSLFIRPSSNSSTNLSSRFLGVIKSIYQPLLRKALQLRYIVIALALILLVATGFIFKNLGSEFVPTLDEGDFVIQPVLKTGMSLTKTIVMTTHMERILRRIPEVKQVVSRIGAAEVPTDPMSMEESDIIITLYPPNEWESAQTKDELADVLKEAIEKEIPNVEIEFTQPIEMRFNELISGVQSDLAIKLYGDDLDLLQEKAIQIRNAISSVEGAADISYEKTAGLPQMMVKYKRNEIAKYGVSINTLNQIVSMGFAGQSAGIIYEGEKQFDLVIRYKSENRNDLNSLRRAMVSLPNGSQLPLSTFADIDYTTGPAQISRDNTKRRTVVGVNVRGRDLQSVVDDVRQIIDTQIKLPPGYIIEYGGQFENLESASRRLMIAVPISLVLIFVLLFFAFKSISEALIVYTAIPLSAVGGVVLLYLRDMPFSISAGVGFIALFGIAVLNGIVLIEHYNELKLQGVTDVYERVLKGTTDRLRPVLLTASAAALGFLPMAISTSAGAEVQRPLATVVIGGLFTATILTLFVLPILYAMLEKSKWIRSKTNTTLVILLLGIVSPNLSKSQSTDALNELIAKAIDNSIELQTGALKVQQSQFAINANKDVDKTALFYSYDRNNTTNTGPALHILGASQSFKLPGYYDAIENVGNELTTLQERRIEIHKAHIALNVSRSYYSILHYNSLISEYEYLDSLYTNFQIASNRKFELGESNLLEKITAEAKRNEINLKLEQTLRERTMAKNRLIQWVRDSSKNIGISTKNTIIIVTETGTEEHPILNYSLQEIQVAKSNKSLINKNKLPELNLTLFNGFNGFNEFALYPGIEAGISVPLWKKAYNAKTEVAALEIKIKEKQLEQVEYNLNTRRIQLLDELALYKKAIDQYMDTGIELQSNLIQTAIRSLKGGEIDFFQYIQTLENASLIRINYHDQLNKYNQTVIKLQYLLN